MVENALKGFAALQARLQPAAVAHSSTRSELPTIPTADQEPTTPKDDDDDAEVVEQPKVAKAVAKWGAKASIASSRLPPAPPPPRRPEQKKDEHDLKDTSSWWNYNSDWPAKSDGPDWNGSSSSSGEKGRWVSKWDEELQQWGPSTWQVRGPRGGKRHNWESARLAAVQSGTLGAFLDANKRPKTVDEDAEFKLHNWW